MKRQNPFISENEKSKDHTKIAKIEKYKFQVSPRDRFRVKFPFFREPNEIGKFSLDIDRKFYNDGRQLKYYIAPENANSVDFNLRTGYKEMVRKDENVKEYIDDLLRWICCSKEKFLLKSDLQEDSGGTSSITSPSSKLNTDFVCWRGLLTKFLITPFDNRDGWLVAVTLHNGTYYMCEFDTEEKKKEKEKMTERHDEMCYWGWKFEKYLTAAEADGKPDTHIPVNNTEAFCTVVRSRLSDHSLVFAGEVDALIDQATTKCKYVELKTSREIDNPKQDQNFKRHKLIKWWAQSFLVGIRKIVSGFRDDNGVVHRLQTFETLQIPEMVKSIPNPWNSAICFNFLDQFLKFVKETVTEDNHRVVYLMQWNPREDVQCQKLPPDSEYTFLPDWYTNPVTADQAANSHLVESAVR